MAPVTYNQDEINKMVDKCQEEVVALRHKLAMEYDCRIVFACFLDAVSSLGASMLHTKVENADSITQKLMYLATDMLTRPSETRLVTVPTDLKGPETKQ
jgi:hypothetical protein